MTQTDKSLYSKNTNINYYRLNSKSININFFHFILYYFMSLFIFQFIPYNRLCHLLHDELLQPIKYVFSVKYKEKYFSSFTSLHI